MFPWGPASVRGQDRPLDGRRLAITYLPRPAITDDQKFSAKLVVGLTLAKWAAASLSMRSSSAGT